MPRFTLIVLTYSYPPVVIVVTKLYKHKLQDKEKKTLLKRMDKNVILF